MVRKWHLSGLTNGQCAPWRVKYLLCQGGPGCVASQEEDAVQGHDLVGNFEHNVGRTLSHSNHSPLLPGGPRYGRFVLCPEEPQATCPCSGGRWGGHQPGPACFPLATRWALLVSGGEASSSACCGTPAPSEHPAEEASRLPSPRLRAGGCGADAGAAGRRWPRPCPLGVPGWSRPARCTAVRARRRTRQRQVKCPGVLALPRNPPSLLFCPPLASLSPFPAWTPRGFPLCIQGFFSEVLRAWLQGGGRALTAQGLISKTCDYEVSFLVIELQIRQRLQRSDKMSRISLCVRAAVQGAREGDLGAPHSWRVLQGCHLGDRSTACVAVVRGTICGEMLDGIGRRSPQGGLELLLWTSANRLVSLTEGTV